MANRGQQAIYNDMNNFAKDPSNAYQKAYYDKLYNQISLIKGKYIPIYDSVPNDAVAPFIILSTTTLTPIHTSDIFIFRGTMLLDIVTRFPAGSGGQKLSNDIANEVFQKILGRGNFYSDKEWNIYTASLGDTRPMESSSGTGTVYRKLITFNNQIQQL
jgi:hypothetical protein